MELKDSQRKSREVSIEKRSYEPPKAVLAPVRIDERLMQCDFSSYRVCGPNR